MDPEVMAPPPPPQPVGIGDVASALIIGVVTVALGLLVGKFERLFDQVGVALPAPTQLFVSIPPTVYQFLALIGAVGFLCIKWKAPTEERSRRWVKRWVWAWVGFWALGAWALGMPYLSLLQGLGG